MEGKVVDKEDLKRTEELEDILLNNEHDDILSFIKRHTNKDYHDFTSYMDHLLEERKLLRRDVIQKADLPLKYGYKLLTQETKTSDRDKLLRLFISMKLNTEECNRALKYYGLSPLYARKLRDAILMQEIQKQHGSVDLVNDRLILESEVILSESK